MIKVLLLFILFNNVFAEYGLELIKKAKDANLKSISSKPLNELSNVMNNRINLGKKLYFDPRFSKSNLISCNTCHNLSLSGTNYNKNIQKIINKIDSNNSLDIPTIYNVLFNKAFFLDGSINSDNNNKNVLKKVVEKELLKIYDKKYIVSIINNNKSYVLEFKKAYGNNINIDFDLIADTIVIFLNTLSTPSRYDDFLDGNIKALSKEEQEGLNIFIDKGCVICHNDVNLGGNVISKALYRKYRFYKNISNIKSIKVPTLRNIIETAPYFYYGEISEIKDAIHYMNDGSYAISEDDLEKLMYFLYSLSGKKPEFLYPMLPLE